MSCTKEGVKLATVELPTTVGVNEQYWVIGLFVCNLGKERLEVFKGLGFVFQKIDIFVPSELIGDFEVVFKAVVETPVGFL